jgi:hypothetical protein
VWLKSEKEMSASVEGGYVHSLRRSVDWSEGLTAARFRRPGRFCQHQVFGNDGAADNQIPLYSCPFFSFL